MNSAPKALGAAFSGTFTLTDPEAAEAFFSELQQQAEAEWPGTLTRIQEMARLSGMEVVYDVSRAGFAWNPVYRYGSDQPVAWVCANTGQRSDGPDSPEVEA